MDIEWESDSTHRDQQAWCFYKLVDGVWMLHIGEDTWVPSDSLVNGETKPEDLIAR